jgi:hypothetical protein
MLATTLEKQELHRLIEDLRDDNVEKIVSYAAFLKYLQTIEDEEDIAACLERRDEPSYSLEEVKRELGLQ